MATAGGKRKVCGCSKQGTWMFLKERADGTMHAFDRVPQLMLDVCLTFAQSHEWPETHPIVLGKLIWQ